MSRARVLKSPSHDGIRLRGVFSVFLLAVLAACQGPVRPVLPEPERALPEPIQAPEPLKPPPAPLPEPPPAEPELDLYQRLRAQLGTDHCDASAEQQRWVRLYAPGPQSFSAQLAPMLPLLDYVLQQIEAADLPGEFALIPIIESSYRPQARSPQGPVGLWQFTANTARGFGLQVTAAHDERLSVVDATDAALDLLGDLQQSHGDWVLAAAGFNAGAFRIRKLLEQGPAPEPGELPPGLARGTYEYVQKLKAWACMLSTPERFGLELPDPQSFERLRRVSAPAEVQRLALLAEISGKSADALRSLNPLLRPQALRRGESELLLPENAAAELLQFVELARRGEASLPPPRFHIVDAGETLSKIARRYQVPLAELMRFNRLTAASILRIGQELRLEP
jgi:membrane-bound lytic murein transglycosylase D